jgi:hypothetical protein
MKRSVEEGTNLFMNGKKIWTNGKKKPQSTQLDNFAIIVVRAPENRSTQPFRNEQLDSVILGRKWNGKRQSSRGKCPVSWRMRENVANINRMNMNGITVPIF